MRLRMNIDVKLDDKMTIMDLQKISEEKFKNKYYLWDTLAIKLGIYRVGGAVITTSDSHFYIYDNGDVGVFLDVNVPLLKELNKYKHFIVEFEDDDHYVSEKTGIFKDNLDEYFGYKKKINFEEILGDNGEFNIDDFDIDTNNLEFK